MALVGRYVIRGVFDGPNEALDHFESKHGRIKKAVFMRGEYDTRGAVQLADDDKVNQPAHYNSHPSGIECIQITEHMNFNLGNAIKYIWRHGLKGRAIQDLKKAAWYIQREIARLERGGK